MKKEKTMNELCKEFPDKGYRELEKYRDADRVEEAIGIGHNHPPKDEQAGVCIMGEMRKDREETDWQEKYNKEHKLRQEAEGELTILKGIETNRVKEAQARCNHLQDELDRIKKENNDLFNRIADALEVNESHQKVNGKLQERLTELEEENKKMHDHLNKKIEGARKAGL